MNSFLRIGLVAIPSLLAGCSLISDFGDIDYVESDAGEGDGGGTGGAGGDTGGTGGDGGGTGGDGGGTGGTGGDGGGTGGTGGTEFMCMSGDDGGCVDCEDDGDCTTNVCVDGLCVQCDGDADCAPGVCVSNSCVDCRIDTDCADDFKCLTASNECTPIRKPTGVWVSAGGGEISSTSYTARIFVLGIQPSGSTSSTNYQITLGPAAGRE